MTSRLLKTLHDTAQDFADIGLIDPQTLRKTGSGLVFCYSFSPKKFERKPNCETATAGKKQDLTPSFYRTDTLTPAARSERMSRIHGKDTKPEIKVRRLIHGMGYRYRLHRGNLPGRPDLVFSSRRKVIFVHGCFWHRHPDTRCKLARLPKSRLDFWRPKLESNRARDIENQKKLAEAGWQVLVLWECELRDASDLAQRIQDLSRR